MIWALLHKAKNYDNFVINGKSCGILDSEWLLHNVGMVLTINGKVVIIFSFMQQAPVYASTNQTCKLVDGTRQENRVKNNRDKEGGSFGVEVDIGQSAALYQLHHTDEDVHY